MIIRDCCPECGSKNFKKNGHTHNGKQNHQCKDCKREFVLNPEKKTISEEKKELIKKLLLEKIALRGICRVVDVSLQWLSGFIITIYDALPDDLNVETINSKHGVIIL